MRLTPGVAWRAGAAGAPLDARLLPLLREIRARTTLRAAAAAIKLSYRHAWDLLGAHGRLLGAPLVRLERGRGARLTPLAERLLEADGAARRELQRAAARLAVSVEPEPATTPGALRIVASHDPLLAEFVAAVGLHAELNFRGSADSLAAYGRGEADVAGFHVSPGEAAPAGLNPRRDRLIRFAGREQGLIVAPGNPKKLRRLDDLARRGIRFVNRQRGSGTRSLIDRGLKAARIAPGDIAGYADEEFTHLAVAASVAAGRADAGVGVRAAASRFKLDFVPLEVERYWLAVRHRQLRDARLRLLLDALRSDAPARLAKRLTGYDVAGAGETCTLDVLRGRPAR